MNTITILLMVIAFLYTAGFSVQLWKEKNKVGSITVSILAISIVVTPFFTILR